MTSVSGIQSTFGSGDSRNFRSAFTPTRGSPLISPLFQEKRCPAAAGRVADSDQALTLPVGLGLAKTTKLGGKPWKFQVQYFAEQPDAFGPEWLLKLTITPVIKNPFL